MIKPSPDLIDRRSDRALYLQLADLYRNWIEAGDLEPEEELPSVREMMVLFDLKRDVTMKGMNELKKGGWVVIGKGKKARVRSAPPRSNVPLNPGDSSISRMPTPAESKQADADEGNPLTFVTRADGTKEVYQARLIRLVGPES